MVGQGVKGLLELIQTPSQIAFEADSFFVKTFLHPKKPQRCLRITVPHLTQQLIPFRPGEGWWFH
jgi:hypothetical protein